MDPIIKEKWTTALTDGSYRQGTDVLRTQNDEYEKPKYCCLGVLCDIYDLTHPESNIWQKTVIHGPMLSRKRSGSGPN